VRDLALMRSREGVRRSEPKLVAVVAARYSSSRLSGKVVRPLAGRPLLAHTLERLQAVDRLDVIVIATSSERSDDAVAAFAETCAVPCWRGALNDVLGRLRDAAAAWEADAIVRISGDSPLIDPAIVATAVELYLDGAADVVTNVFPRSFPKGQSVEVVSRRALERLAAEAVAAADREHVTRYAYEHPERFVIRNFAAVRPRPELQLSVDTAADFERVAALLAATSGATFASVDRLVDLADALPAIS
ncbi:MAG TPA: NTP transferase domain-containing protein, partial [Xanthobacteraceae bacterium]|nr:NTP transferase domain-containing protein [Xanthobacteraceae bacterium]